MLCKLWGVFKGLGWLIFIVIWWLFHGGGNWNSNLYHVKFTSENSNKKR